MSIYNLSAAQRSSVKATKNKLRSMGKIPAVVYAKEMASLPLLLENRDVEAMFHSHFTLVRLQMEGKGQEMVVVKEIQRDPSTHRLLHVTFEVVHEGVPFKIGLPLKFNYDEKAEWVVGKGTVKQAIKLLNVEVKPKDLPEFIEVSLEHLKMGESLHISDLKLPGIKFLDHPEQEVATILPPRLYVEEEASEEKASAVPAATAVVNKGAVASA